MARPKSNRQKVKVTVTLDPEVVEALGPLQATLEASAYGTLAKKELETLYGPIRYSRSSVIQMAILMMCKKHDVEVHWTKPPALDLHTGQTVPAE